MISRNSRNGVIVLSALLLVSIWAARQNERDEDRPIEGLDDRASIQQ